MWTVMESPVGDLRLVEERGSITRIQFMPFDEPGEGRDDAHPLLAAAVTQLTEYFDGTRTGFDLPLDPRGSQFQVQVWRQLLRIPYGQTISYRQLAERCEMSANGSRAVGTANGKNPIPIVIPCHRVIGADGGLTGYAGGIARKQKLLDLEQGSLL